MKFQLKPALKTLGITATGIGLVSLALSAHPGQAELDSYDMPEMMPLMAQGMGGSPEMGGNPEMGPGGRWLDALNLSEAQQQQIKAIREQYKPQMEANRTAVQAARDDLRRLMSGTASDSELRQKHNQLQDLMRQGGTLRFESMLAVRNVLTTEQRQQAATFMEQHRERMHDRWEERHGDNGPGMGGMRRGDR